MAAKKRAIVTGVSSGIGQAIALSLVADGWKVFGVARRADRLKKLEKKTAGKLIGFEADITADGAPEAIIAAGVKALGGLDLLVNNAGTSWVGQAADMPTDQIDRIMNTNVRALMLLCREAVGHLEKSDCGQILNVGSVVGHMPMSTIAVYCASKAAMIMFSKVLANELAPKKIRANILSPTGTDTEIFEKAGSKVDPALLVPAKAMGDLAVLMTRWPKGMDVNEVVCHRPLEPFFA